jgi:phosphatidylglycerol:prolipoprotein diacylglycerol transferase
VPDSGRFKAGEAWVQEAATKAGISLSSASELVNLPRHPSQLYEALLEGLLLFAVVWLYSRRSRPVGSVTGLFLAGYGLARFAVEFVREPDAQLGYLAFGWLTMGQVLSTPMILLGVWLIWRADRGGGQ